MLPRPNITMLQNTHVLLLPMIIGARDVCLCDLALANPITTVQSLDMAYVVAGSTFNKNDFSLLI